MNRLARWLCIAAVTFVSTASVAQGAIILSTADSIENFTWSFTTGGGAVLDGSGSISATGFNSTSLVLTISLTNGASLASERLTAFGFGITPNATAVAFSDVADDGIVGAVLGGNFPAFQTVEVCAYGGQNCAGGGNGGIPGGLVNNSDTFVLTLTGTWGTSVTLDPVAFKYQTNAGSFEFDTGSGPGTGPGTATGSGLPEPTTTALLTMGVGMLGAAIRRRRAAR